MFFNARPEYLLKTLPPGETRIVSGVVDTFGEGLQMVHPDYVLADTEEGEPAGDGAGLSPYLRDDREDANEGDQGRPAAGAGSRRVARPHLPRAARLASLAGGAGASACAHHGRRSPPLAPARARLAFDELLANQLALAIVRRRLRRQAGRTIRVEGSLARQVVSGSAFGSPPRSRRRSRRSSPTWRGPTRMLRLLQGDVGSGKTVVALLAMLNAVESGAQAALMAPTELLARRHHATIAKLAEAAGVHVAVLTGREKEAARGPRCRPGRGRDRMSSAHMRCCRSSWRSGTRRWSVIDEQHRFGVEQRLALRRRVRGGRPGDDGNAHSAHADDDRVRRPRRLAADREAARAPADRHLLHGDRSPGRVVPAIAATLGRRQVYLVCPLVEDRKRAIRPPPSSGRPSCSAPSPARRPGARADEDGRAGRGMRRSRRAIGVLVATTVIEVGIDVPAATVMLIEHAERFGLAQLHQLRGRIGRGAAPRPASCLSAPRISEAARTRLAVCARRRRLPHRRGGPAAARRGRTARGAAERPASLPRRRPRGPRGAAGRGAGRHPALLERDPDLTSPRGRALRALLYLFERDQL